MKFFINAFFVLFILGTCVSCSHYTTESGERSGTVIQLGEEGLFFKTWDAELIKGGLNNASGGFGVHPFYFTVRDKSLLPAVQKAFNDGKEITISYHRELFCFTDSGSHCYYVDGVKQ